MNKIDKKNNGYIEEHMYIFKYKGLIRKKIIDYKFNQKAYLHRFFEKIILNDKKVCDFIKSYDIIIPVPINKKKKRERGYNQTSVITSNLASKIKNIQLKDDILLKKEAAKTQSLLNKTERRKNVIGAFDVAKNANIVGKKILIFDDIYTTGNTVNECAKILRQIGAIKVGVLTIAKD